MTNPINLISSIGKQVHTLAEEMERFKWEINPQGIEDATVRAFMKEGEAQALVRLLKLSKVDEATRKTLLQTLSKIEKKIAFIHKTIAYISSGSQDADPRITKVLSKVGNKHAPITSKKIRQYFAGLEQFIEFNSLNEKSNTMGLVKDTQWELNSKRLALLASMPDYDICELPLDRLIEGCLPFYQKPEISGNGTDITPEIKRKGLELTLIHFFEKMLDPQWIALSQSHSSDFVRGLVEGAHTLACSSFQIGDTQDYSPLRFIDESPDESDDEVDLPTDAWNAQLARYEKENFVSLSLKSNCQDIEELLLLMNGSANKAHLKGIGALITLGDHSKLAMIIHSTDSPDGPKSIVVFNPQGDKARNGCPYLVSFGSVQQAAKFLHDKMVDIKQNSKLELSDGQLFTLAYRSELQATIDRNQAKLDEMEANRIIEQHENVEPLEAAEQPEAIVINEPNLSFWDLQKQAIDSLQKAIDALSNNTEEGLILAVAALTAYSGKASLLDPISTRLFQLQDAELREKISQKGDIISWGATAFQSDDTPSDQKLRAVQRALVPLLFYNLRLCLQDSDLAANVPEILKLMEGLKLNSTDLPEGQGNLAHSLFGTTYHTYLAAWDKKQDMIHPHDGLFENDFGRNAYLGSEKARTAVDNVYKLEAIEKVQNLLEDIWKA